MTPTRRFQLQVSAMVAVMAVVTLAVAAGRSQPVRALSVGASPTHPITIVSDGHSACARPLTSPIAFETVDLWGSSLGGTIGVTVYRRGPAPRTVLASGRLLVPDHAGVGYNVALDRTVDAGTPLVVCVEGIRKAAALLGSIPAYESLGRADAPPPPQFAMVLTSDRGHTLLDSLETAFSRASLFRPSWVAPWVFWTLLVLAILSIALAIGGLWLAVRADDEVEGGIEPSSPVRGSSD